MPQQDTPHEPAPTCIICRRPAPEWILKLTLEDAGGLKHEGLVCPNCGVKLRLSSQKIRHLQIDPWVHDAVALVLRGRQPEDEE